MGTFKEHMYEGFKYKLYIPNQSLEETPLPMVVMLHGCEQSSDQFANETRMNVLAEKEQFLVLYPSMNRFFNPLFDEPHKFNPAGCWNWFLDENHHREEGLPRIIANMIHAVEKILNNKYNVFMDKNKIFAAGFSAGGAMAGILGVTYPELFNGIAICSGLPYNAAKTNFWKDPWNKEAEYAMKNGVKDPYESGRKAYQESLKAFTLMKSTKKIPMIVFHGLKDTTVNQKNSNQLIIQWAQMYHLIDGGQGKVNVIPSKVKRDHVENGKSYTKHVYQDSQKKNLIEFWQVDDMNHVWSGGKKGKFSDPLGPDATTIIWDFFKRVTN